VSRAIANASLFNILHVRHVVKVDLIVKKETKFEQQKFERRAMVIVEGISISIISKEDLILSKLLWHSEFQLRDVRNLLISSYDSGYVESWAEELDVDDLLNECLNE
jgi:hypothetical protein